jgi:prenylcysteine oxidase/farnesylcysteine lyase
MDGSVSWIHHKIWHSYPEERPRVTFDEIKLDDGLWYTSAMEPFISTMETSALAGKNVARLIIDRWMKRGSEEGLALKPAADSAFEGVEGDDQMPLKAKL